MSNISTIPGSSTPTGITTIAGNTGSTSNSTVTFSGSNSGSTIAFVVTGSTVNLNNTSSQGSIVFGETSGTATNGVQNTIIGSSAASAIQGTSVANVSIGFGTFGTLTTGTGNVALGTGALKSITTGNSSTCIGEDAGFNYTGTESSNICLGNSVLGTTGESNVCRIGSATGTGDSQVNKTFIAGIRGITTVNADAVAVLIDSAGQLGTVSSSSRYKNNIQDMGDQSSPIMNLRPVTFSYNSHSDNSKSYGLIAEEVAQTFPDLVVYKDGLAETVKYHELPVILLNELKKQSKEIQELKSLLKGK